VHLKTKSYFRKNFVIVSEFTIEAVFVPVKQVTPEGNVYFIRHFEIKPRADRQS